MVKVLIILVIGLIALGVIVGRFWCCRISSKEKEVCSLKILAAKELEVSKNAFISMVSHELRTPLTSILGALKMLEKREDLNPEEMKRLLVLANRNAEKLLWIINDILDVQKIQLGELRLNLQAILIVAPIQRAIEDLTPIMLAKQIHLVEESVLASIRVLADEKRLEQVMVKLLSNAIRFSLPNGKITVAMEIRDKNVRVSVKDQGMGIPPEFQNQIFQAFSQQAIGDTRTGGAGLGLTICKNIIEHMKGTLAFTSEPGKETVFYFELPILEGGA